MNKKIIISIIILLIILIFVIVVISAKPNKKESKATIVEENVYREVSNIKEEKETVRTIKISVNNTDLIVELENNSSVDAFVEKLEKGDVTVKAHDYGNFEKVGDLGFSLPTNDKSIRTEAGDLILYQGNQITLYYDTNSWTFTKLGKVKSITQEELKKILGDGDVTLVFSIY